jgi:lipopolysaccharide/colanic/teichoic acid biosynthesis glycosyltransferase
LSLTSRATRRSPGAAPDHAASETPSEESLADRYARMSLAYERRGIDFVLRGMDIAIAGTALLISSPLLALISAAILLTSGRPVLYRGKRVGRFGRVFTMYKLRTLKPDAEARLGPYYGDELTRRTEEEVSSVGRALRAAHLDEIPQLWNVLRGDMSIVGPRPIRPSFFEELCARIPQYWQRLVVRPGVTGFAQTRITREEAWGYKLAHDLEYIADRSVRLYLAVLAATVWRIGGNTAAGGRRIIGRDEP